MMTMNKAKIKSSTALGLAAVFSLGLSACGTTNSPYGNDNSNTVYPRTTNSNTSGAYAEYGVVQSIEVIRTNNASANNNDVGLGTLAGAVVGGVVGNQVGGGRGNTAATVIGAAGGAFAGHQLEKQHRQNQPQDEAYKFTIRMNNGALQTFTQSSAADIRVGDRVQIEGGAIRRY